MLQNGLENGCLGSSSLPRRSKTHPAPEVEVDEKIEVAPSGMPETSSIRMMLLLLDLIPSVMRMHHSTNLVENQCLMLVRCRPSLGQNSRPSIHEMHTLSSPLFSTEKGIRSSSSMGGLDDIDPSNSTLSILMVPP